MSYQKANLWNIFKSRTKQTFRMGIIWKPRCISTSTSCYFVERGHTLSTVQCCVWSHRRGEYHHYYLPSILPPLFGCNLSCLVKTLNPSFPKNISKINFLARPGTVEGTYHSYLISRSEDWTGECILPNSRQLARVWTAVRAVSHPSRNQNVARYSA